MQVKMEEKTLPKQGFNMLKVAIAAGGTGGHVFPAIAIAEEFIHQVKDVSITFIGSEDGMEKEIILEKGFEFESISVKKLYRFLTPKNLLFPYYLLKSVFQTRRILKKNECDIFIGCGGFVSGAAGLGAKGVGIPIFLQEQNSFPGISTRKLAKSSKIIFLGNPEAKEYLNLDNSRLIYTGNPIRKMEKVDKAKAKKFWGLDDRKVIFVYGGSQGAKSINDNVVKIIEDLLKKDLQIIFQTGKNKYQKIYEKIGQQKSVVIKSFIRQMDLAYSAADLVVCRAGAISLSEIAFYELPAILIPFPKSSGNHQVKNAESLKKQGAAELLLDKNLNPENLKNKIMNIILDEMKSKLMSKAIKKFAKPESAKEIVEIILQQRDIPFDKR